jgi:hypothetical protein
MRKSSQAGYIMRHRGWWVLRYRERVGVAEKSRAFRGRSVSRQLTLSTKQRRVFVISQNGNLIWFCEVPQNRFGSQSWVISSTVCTYPSRSSRRDLQRTAGTVRYGWST